MYRGYFKKTISDLLSENIKNKYYRNLAINRIYWFIQRNSHLDFLALYVPEMSLDTYLEQ